MSTLKVQVLEIEKVEVHPNADKLDLVTVKGWQCVVSKDQYKVGDKIIYIPIDSILPEELENKIFEGSKVKLDNHRVRTIKLRGAISQGLVTSLKLAGISENSEIELDITKKLGIIKYEPPVPSFQKIVNNNSKKIIHPNFSKYSSLENIKNHKKLFKNEDEVIITEKIHGTNFRAGWVPFYADTFLKKIKQFFGLSPKYEFVYGSHNVQLSNKLIYNGFYEKNIYAEIVIKYNLKDKLQKGEVIYGEIYGADVQKNYTYGCKSNEHKFIAFDLKVNNQYIDHKDLVKRLSSIEIPMVPILYEGILESVDLYELVLGNSILEPKQKIREGVVVRSKIESESYIGRKILKVISPEYLLKDNTEFH